MKSVLLSTAVVAFGLSMSACSSMSSFNFDNVQFDDGVWAQEETVVVAAAAVAVGGYFLWDQSQKMNSARADREAAEQERIAHERGVALNAQRCAADPWTVRVVDEANFVYEYCDGSTRVNEKLKAESAAEVELAEQMLSSRFEALEPLAKYKTAARACEAAVNLMYKAHQSGSEYKMLQAYEEWTKLSSVYAEWKDLISPLDGGSHTYNVTGAGWVAGGAMYSEYANSYTLYSDARAHTIDECRAVDY